MERQAFGFIDVPLKTSPITKKRYITKLHSFFMIYRLLALNFKVHTQNSANFEHTSTKLVNCQQIRKYSSLINYHKILFARHDSHCHPLAKSARFCYAIEKRPITKPPFYSATYRSIQLYFSPQQTEPTSRRCFRLSSRRLRLQQ